MGDTVVFIGRYDCGGCTSFKPEWQKLTQDEDVKKRVILREHIAGMHPDGKQYSIMQCFGFVQYVPTILYIKHSDYDLFFEDNDGVTQQKIPGYIPAEAYSGSRTYKDIKTWIMSK